MFGRVPTTRNYRPIALTDPDDLPIVHAHMSSRQPRHCARKTAPASLPHRVDSLFVIACKSPVAQDIFWRMLQLVTRQHPRHQPLGPVHPDWNLELVRQPASTTYMIGMEVRHKDSL